jgi:hypothetical protein
VSENFSVENEAILNIREAGAIYLYIKSFTDDESPTKDNIIKRWNISEKKYEKSMQYLKDRNFINKDY